MENFGRLLFGFLFLMIGSSAKAQTTYTWNGAGSTNGIWSDGVNWSGTAPPSSTSLTNAVMAGTTSLFTTLDLPLLGGGFGLQSLTFNSTAGAFSVDPSGTNLTSLTIGAGGISVANNNTQTIGVGITLASNQTFTTGSGTGSLVLNGTIGASGQSLTFGGSGTISVGGRLATGGALIQSGSGTTIVSGNTTAGTPTSISISSGTFAVNPVGGVNPIGTAPITLSGGSISFRSLTNPITITGFNQDVVAEVGATSATSYGTTAAVDGSPKYVFFQKGFGGTNIGGLPTGGRFVGLNNATYTYQLASYTANNSLQLTNASTTGTLTFATPATYKSISILSDTGSGSSAMAFTLNFSDGTTTSVGATTIPDWFGGTPYAYVANGRITRTGTYDQVSSGNPRLYPTDYTLSATDAAKNLKSISFTGSVFGSADTTLNIYAVSGLQTGVTQSYTNAVTVSGNATVDQSGIGNLTLGTLSINGSTLSTTGDTGASLTFGQTTLTGNATFNTAANTTTKLDITSGANLGITKQGIGTLSLYGANTYTGATIVQAGTLALTGTASLASKQIIIGDTSANSGAILDLSGLSTSLSIGTGQTLSGFGTISGAKIIDSGGTILPGSSTAVGVLNDGNTTFNAGGSFNFLYDNTKRRPTAGTDSSELIGATGSSLSLASLSTSNKFNLNINALLPAGAPGSNNPITYIFASYPSITGLTPGDVTAYFNVTGLYGSTPSVQLVHTGGGTPDMLQLVFAPVPESRGLMGILVAIGFAGMAIRRRAIFSL